ncbi:DUF928 domain-containing protein [Roseofilum casamattae]|uniref:DUF928 domain-containing protein n=1 Tax=Roseofilum casamattae BLCC-M143 TaxID=3022442 RepID=A0ABT7BUA2_9CYAN|nr:DUF928 domain-containing protein [Roseofilum casamattae]MDJ1182763.1 DUF928 domain-containing protein [Roseofilum casamattae BLCC-M143]
MLKFTQKTLILAILATLGGQSSLQANPNIYLAQTFKPPGRGAPPKTADAGTRGCTISAGERQSLTALVPGEALALTTQEKPTLFWYLPEAKGKTVQFTLLDRNDETIIYETEIGGLSQSGIVGIDLSQIAPTSKGTTGLEVDRLYHWYMVIVCDPTDRTGDVVVDGWIERVEPSQALQAQLQNTAAVDRAKIYAEAGIWHDALSAIAKQYYSGSANPAIAAQWETLLRSVELDAFTNTPILKMSQR